MSHKVIIIGNSLLEIFDPSNTEYAGTRDHFTTAQLAEIDRLRAVDPDTYTYTLQDKAFICYVIDKAIFTAED